jgi:hypothetical protein
MRQASASFAFRANNAEKDDSLGWSRNALESSESFQAALASALKGLVADFRSGKSSAVFAALALALDNPEMRNHRRRRAVGLRWRQ